MVEWQFLKNFCFKYIMKYESMKSYWFVEDAVWLSFNGPVYPILTKNHNSSTVPLVEYLVIS